MNTQHVEPEQEDRINKCCKALLHSGWRESPNQFKTYARCFYRPFENVTACRGNEDKQGVQIEVAVSPGFAEGVSMEMELVAGLNDETWMKIQNYSLPETVEEVTTLIPRILEMWEAAARWTAK